MFARSNVPQGQIVQAVLLVSETTSNLWEVAAIFGSVTSNLERVTAYLEHVSGSFGRAIVKFGACDR